ncbi:hypothetical protein B0T19DRAFT_467446 [Cercophora scortea]|uniref:Uncharacterized protein n=1 Tax=Cercophora scortea TaxID=314031 RepID=A0AAE0I8Q2_9PEZI|nr:hypothetical protein B0T19DRAFT_467446 [Cercophora scortea]
MANSTWTRLARFWRPSSSQISPGVYHDIDGKDADAESQEGLLEEDGEELNSAGESLKWRIIRICTLLAKIFFIVSYVLLAYRAWKSRQQETCILGNEKIFDDVPVIYESARFQRAGFHDSRHNTLNIYEGAPNGENEKAWKRLLDVGVVLISDDESSRITNGSASTRQDAHKHIVELEMFHQLHCLKWLRDQFWECHAAFEMTHPVISDVPQRSNPTDHCIDYLRQVIMCHGDITPITFE